MGVRIKRYGKTEYLNDHNQLKNTDIEDQHPIKAITGLNEKLDDIDNNISINIDDIRNNRNDIDIINKMIENGEIGGGSGGVSDITPLVERVKVLEQNVVILNNNNLELKEFVISVLNEVNRLEDELVKTKLIVDEYHKNTNLSKNSFTDTLINDDYIQNLIDCKIDINNDNVT
ncbi:MULTISPECIES: hypothetical protein [unclassified Clostridioides]|uniref:hypothetical protein n=1 Tax=unclassified Clostridioides TaxID=2635829 RepID=UPI001D109CA3|nr:hypothetical protein [Clostridioides sp. ES-S-0049-03]MCC0657301.1 hypothetical protein [Clostridioides sp. ES-S-0123-01]MCC0672706.1 hypothetical protein [Clostridioides sp. ES-S-0145-01]MCC0675362.1 hypothetical protein [Clostridioides sp. ES-W-0018-02]MCC0709829.1 hypothetical protein [Clostridioides sp. ES-W-0017-02]